MTVGYDLSGRILGSLAGVAVGDALGFPLHDMPHEEILRRFGGPVDRMVSAFEDDFIHVGFKAGQVTDDTLLTIETAKAIMSQGGKLTADSMAQWLGDWARANESVWKIGEVFGPSTKKALSEFSVPGFKWQMNRRRAPAESGASNGGAMRVAPAGLVHPGRIKEAIALAYEAVAPTHGTQVAIAAAAAQAAGVAAALVEGADVPSVVGATLVGAREGEAIGRERARIVPAPSVAQRIETAVALAVAASGPQEAGRMIQDRLGTNLPAAEAVPAAIGLFVASRGDPREGMVAAASIGGDTDTIASMVGALSGALRGIDAIPKEWLTAVEVMNGLQLNAISVELTKLAERL